MSAPLFSQLVALGREEHAMVLDGRYDELAGLNARREALMAQLPATAPAEAMADLREAARLQALTTVALREARDDVAARLAQARTTRRGVQGYAAVNGRPASGGSSFSSAA